MDLDECLKKEFVKRTKVDKELISSLIEMSDIKDFVIKTAKINDKTISVYVSIAYDSLREVLEALCILNGYKVISHVCIGELLKSLINDFNYNEFDRLRYIRNSINYYGQKMDFNQGKEIITKILSMKNEIKEKYLKK